MRFDEVLRAGSRETVEIKDPDSVGVTQVSTSHCVSTTVNAKTCDTLSGIVGSPEDAVMTHSQSKDSRAEKNPARSESRVQSIHARRARRGAGGLTPDTVDLTDRGKRDAIY